MNKKAGQLLILLAILFVTTTAYGSYALVGTIGVASQGAISASVTPAWGTGESRTAGNLLVCFVGVTEVNTSLSTPSGWSVAASQFGGANNSGAAIYYKIAAGSDTAPTLTGVTNGFISAQLAEFSGNLSSSPLDQSGVTTTISISTPTSLNNGGVDAASGELFVMCSSDYRSTARATNDTWTSNAGTPVQAGNNNGVSSKDHYSFAYILAASAGGAADQSTMTNSNTQNAGGLSMAQASFKLPTSAPVSAQRASNFFVWFTKS